MAKTITILTVCFLALFMMQFAVASLPSTTSDLIMHLSPFNETTYSEGDTVSVIHDWSGNNYHVDVPIVDATRLAVEFHEDGFGEGIPGFYFPSSSHRTAENIFNLDQPITIILVNRLNSTSANSATFFDSVTSADRFLYRYRSSSPFRSMLFAGNTADYDFTVAEARDAEFLISTIIYNRGSSILRVNGETVPCNLCEDIGSNSMTGLRLGSSSDAGSRLTGYFGDFLIFNGTLSAEEIDEVEQYLAAKYDIDLGAPPAASGAEPLFFVNFDGDFKDLITDSEPLETRGSPTIVNLGDGRLAADLAGSSFDYSSSNFFSNVTDQNKPFSIVMRVRNDDPPEGSTIQFLLNFRGSVAANRYWGLFVTGESHPQTNWRDRYSIADFSTGGSTVNVLSGPDNDPENGFVTLVYTHDGGGLVSAYADGELIGTATMNVSNTGSEIPLYLGSRSGGGNDWSGLVDYVVLYNDSLTFSEIQGFNNFEGLGVDLTQHSIDSESSGAEPLFFANFDGTFDDVFNDIGPLLVRGDPSLVDIGNGRFAVNLTDSSLEFDTTNFFSDVTDLNKNFSIVLRVRNDAPPTGTGVNFMFNMRGTTSSRYWAVFTAGNTTSSASWRDRYNFADFSSGGSTVNVLSGPDNDPEEFVTLVYTHEAGGLVSVYADGVYVGDKSFDISNTGSSVPLVLGAAQGGGNNWHGLVDYAILYDDILSFSEIQGFNNFNGLGVDLTHSWSPATDPDPEPPQKYVPPEGLSVGDPINTGQNIFVTPEGNNLEYYAFLRYGSTGPIAIYTNTWSGSVTSGLSRASVMRDNYDFLAIAMNVRGLGQSTGPNDAFGYDCRDVKTILDHVEKYYADFYDPSQGIHILGASGGGGRALICTGRYPDLFTSIFASVPTANLTRWYDTATVENDRTLMRTRTGENLGVTFHPPGFSSVGGSIENLEAYQARDGSLIGATNSMSNILVFHGLSDTRVDPGQSVDFYNRHNALGKTNEFTLHLVDGGHSYFNSTEGNAFLNANRGVIEHPSSGSFIIGGWVETKRFRIEFLDDVGFMGSVNFNLGTRSQFRFEIDTVSYSGPAEVLVKNVGHNLDLYDNGELIGTLRGSSIFNVAAGYTITYSNGDLSIILPHMSPHVVEGITPVSQFVAGDAQETCLGIAESVRNAFNLASIALIVLAAAAILGLLSLGFGGGFSSENINITSIIGLIVVSAVMLVIGAVVFGFVTGAIC